MRLGMLDADLKALQIYFPKRTFTDAAVRKITICFLVVAGEMLDRRRAALCACTPSVIAAAMLPESSGSSE